VTPLQTQDARLVGPNFNLQAPVLGTNTQVLCERRFHVDTDTRPVHSAGFARAHPPPPPHTHAHAHPRTRAHTHTRSRPTYNGGTHLGIQIQRFRTHPLFKALYFSQISSWYTRSRVCPHELRIWSQPARRPHVQRRRQSNATGSRHHE
jgi:hypothetical protein